MPPRPQASSLPARIKPPVYATNTGSDEPINSLTLGNSTSVKIVRSIASNIHARQADPNDSQRMREVSSVRISEAPGSSALILPPAIRAPDRAFKLILVTVTPVRLDRKELGLD